MNTKSGEDEGVEARRERNFDRRCKHSGSRDNEIVKSEPTKVCEEETEAPKWFVRVFV